MPRRAVRKARGQQRTSTRTTASNDARRAAEPNQHSHSWHTHSDGFVLPKDILCIVFEQSPPLPPPLHSVSRWLPLNRLPLNRLPLLLLLLPLLLWLLRLLPPGPRALQPCRRCRCLLCLCLLLPRLLLLLFLLLQLLGCLLTLSLVVFVLRVYF